MRWSFQYISVVSVRWTIEPKEYWPQNSCNWDGRYLLKKLKYLWNFCDLDWCTLYRYHFFYSLPVPMITVLTWCLDFLNFIYSAHIFITSLGQPLKLASGIQVTMWIRLTGDHFTVYTDMDSRSCTPETDIMLQVNYTTIKKSQ